MNRFAYLALMGLCLCLVASGAAAAWDPMAPLGNDSADYSTALAPDAPLLRWGGKSEAVDVQGSYAYLVQGASLLVIDLSTREVVGSLAFGYQAMDVAVHGDYAYIVTDTYGDLQVVDVSNPADPTLVGTGSLSMGGKGLALVWPHVYVLGGTANEMLVVFDVTIPSAPNKVTAITLSHWGYSVAQGPNHLYVLASNYLSIIDITDRANPQEEGGLDVSWANNLTVAEPYVYVTTTVGFSPGVRIVNVSNSDSPQEVGDWSYSYTGDTLGVAVLGDYLYVGYNHNGWDPSHAIHILDVSDPSSPTRSERFATRAGLYDFLIQNTTLYAAGGADGDLLSFDLTSPLSPVQTTIASRPGSTAKVRVAGDRAYLAVKADHDGPWWGVWAYDISDPLSPVVLTKDDPLGGIYDLAVAEPYLYLAGSDACLRIRRTDDLWTPFGHYSHTDGPCNGVAVKGAAAYVTVGFSGSVDVLDVSAPDSPAFARRIPVADDYTNLSQVAIDGNRAYVVEWLEQFTVLDISTPLYPTVLATHPVAGLQTLHPDGDYLYVGAQEGLYVLTVQDPNNIQQIGSFPTLGRLDGIDVVDDIAYLTGSYFAYALDVSTPSSPTQIWSYSGPGEGLGVAGMGLYVLAAGGDLGLGVHAIGDGQVRSQGGDAGAVFPDEALVVTFARPMETASVTYSCSPDPGGWVATWGTARGLTSQAADSRVLTLTHDPFTEGQEYTFTVTAGQTSEGDLIDPFDFTFSVSNVQRIYLPLTTKG